MGAKVATVRAAIKQCGSDCSVHSLEILNDDSSKELVLRVVRAPIEDSRGARITGYKRGALLKVETFQTEHGFEALGWRFREKNRCQWPPSYRFQVPKRSWRAVVVPDDGVGNEQACLLQMPSDAEHRTLENAELDLDDARVAAVYAQRFNLNQLQAICGAPAPAEADAPEVAADAPVASSPDYLLAAAADHSSIPTVHVAAPVACEVMVSGYPSMVPVGTVCTLTPYVEKEVQKFVFDGCSDEFSELPQAYFHYAAFSSGGKEYVCDIQGVEEDDGSFLFVDPCVLRANLPTVRDLIGVVANVECEASKNGPTVERFDALHPRCGEACKAFDPHRRSAMRNGKVGMCGTGVTCGFGR